MTDCLNVDAESRQGIAVGVLSAYQKAQQGKNFSDSGRNDRMAKKMTRTSKGLRDVLFEEIDSLRSGDGDPSRALAVANLAKQIINTVKIELDYNRESLRLQEQGNPMKLGNVELGSIASAADSRVTDRLESTTHEAALSSAQ